MDNKIYNFDNFGSEYIEKNVYCTILLYFFVQSK